MIFKYIWNPTALLWCISCKSLPGGRTRKQDRGGRDMIGFIFSNLFMNHWLEREEYSIIWVLKASERRNSTKSLIIFLVLDTNLKKAGKVPKQKPFQSPVARLINLDSSSFYWSMLYYSCTCEAGYKWTKNGRLRKSNFGASTLTFPKRLFTPKLVDEHNGWRSSRFIDSIEFFEIEVLDEV